MKKIFQKRNRYRNRTWPSMSFYPYPYDTETVIVVAENGTFRYSATVEKKASPEILEAIDTMVNLARRKVTFSEELAMESKKATDYHEGQL